MNNVVYDDLGGNYMIKNVKMGVYNRNGEEFNFNFYTTLQAYDKLEFVNLVTNILVEDNYNSVIRDIAFDIAVVRYLTDVDISDIISEDNNINNIESFLEETNIVEIVKANADEIIEELNDAVDKNIEYRTGIHNNPIADSLSHLINTLEKKIVGIDTDSMMKMAQVIGNMSGELTVDKVVEAYSKSDVFKSLLANRKNLTK